MKSGGYVIHTFDNGSMCICRIVAEYKDRDEAVKDLASLLTREVREEDLMKEKIGRF